MLRVASFLRFFLKQVPRMKPDEATVRANQHEAGQDASLPAGTEDLALERCSRKRDKKIRELAVGTPGLGVTERAVGTSPQGREQIRDAFIIELLPGLPVHYVRDPKRLSFRLLTRGRLN